MLLRLFLNQTHFTFGGQVYHQIEGCPMGSPISVTMANLVLEHVEEVALKLTACMMKFYRWFVNDTFVILNQDHVSDFHSALSSVDPAVQFTCELEKNNALPFLDVNVTHKGTGQRETAVFRKPCDTGNFLNLISHHPAGHKIAVARTLLYRSEQITSNPQLRMAEDFVIVGSLIKRKYPRRFIENTRKQMHRRGPQVKKTFKAGVVTIPYVKGVSESIRRALLPLDVRTTFKPHVRLGNLLSKPKDETPPESKNGVVYKLSCRDCDASYIGETGRKRSTRLKEHKRNVERATQAIRSKTELVDHCWTTGNSFDFVNAEILGREQRWGPRKFVESWCIRGDQSA